MAARRLLRTVAYSSAVLLVLLSLQAAISSEAVSPEAILTVPATEGSLAFVPLPTSLLQYAVPVGLQDNQGTHEAAFVDVDFLQELPEALLHPREGQAGQTHQQNPDAGAVVEVVEPGEVQVERNDHAVLGHGATDDRLVALPFVGGQGQVFRIQTEIQEDCAEPQGDILVEEEPQRLTSSCVNELPAENLRGVLHGGGDVLVDELWVLLKDLLTSVPRGEEFHDQVDGNARPTDDGLPRQDIGIGGDPSVHQKNIRQASYELVGGVHAYVGISVAYDEVASIPMSEEGHVFFPGLRVTRVQSGGNTRYYHSDHPVNPGMVSESTQNVSSAYTLAYRPFGVCAYGCGSDPKYSYTGEYRETSPNLIYLSARWFDPTIGRFISPDDRLGSLSMPQDQNRYAYVVNNPMKYTDPTGHLFWFVLAAFLLAGSISTGYYAATCGNECTVGGALGAFAFGGTIGALTFGAALYGMGAWGMGTAIAGGGYMFTGLTGAAAFMIAGAVSGAIANVAGYVLGSAIAGEAITLEGIGRAALIGGIVGGLTAGAGFAIGRGLGLTMSIRLGPAKGVKAPEAGKAADSPGETLTANPMELLGRGYRVADIGGGAVGRTSASSGGSLRISFLDGRGNAVQYHSAHRFSSGYVEPAHYHFYRPTPGGGYVQVGKGFAGDPMPYWGP